MNRTFFMIPGTLASWQRCRVYNNLALRPRLSIIHHPHMKIIVGPDGRCKTLSPEGNAFCQQFLKQAVLKKMLGLPRTAGFDWHAAAQDTKLPPCPPAYSNLNDATLEIKSQSSIKKPVSRNADNYFKIILNDTQ